MVPSVAEPIAAHVGEDSIEALLFIMSLVFYPVRLK